MRVIGFRGLAVGGAFLMALIAQTQTEAQAFSLSKEAADLVAACGPQVEAYTKYIMAKYNVPRENALAMSIGTADAYSKLTNREFLPKLISDDEKYGDGSAQNKVETCMKKRRLAQLGGKSPPVSGSGKVAATTAATGGSTRNGQSNTQGSAEQGRNAPVSAALGHNAAHDAKQCVQVIGKNAFGSNGIKSTMGAVLRNGCAYDISIVWCVDPGGCTRGYGSTWDIKARDYYPIDVPANQPSTVRYAACNKSNGGGFGPNNSILNRTLQHACK